MWKNKLWMTQILYQSGLILLVALPFHIDSALELLPMLSVYLFTSMVISVGVHRLFCHKAFQTHAFFHWVLGIGSVLAMYGSPIRWAAVHTAHHKYADTDKDPHASPKPIFIGILISLWNRRYRYDLTGVANTRHLVKSKMQVFIHNYYMLIWLVLAAGMLIISPWWFFNAYLPGMAVMQLLTTIIAVAGHYHGKAADIPWMEFIWPAFGEWIHVEHHKHPGNKRHGKYDLGYLVIWLIETRKA